MTSPSAELTLEQMLADPIVQLVMQRDEVTAEDVRAVVGEARRRRRAKTCRRWLHAAE